MLTLDEQRREIDLRAEIASAEAGGPEERLMERDARRAAGAGWLPLALATLVLAAGGLLWRAMS